MLENALLALDQPSPNVRVSAAQGRRAAQLRRIFIKQLKLTRRPTLVQREALNHAIALTLLAEHAAVDPNARLDHVIRVDNAAARARKRLLELAEMPKPLSLTGYLNSKVKT